MEKVRKETTRISTKKICILGLCIALFVTLSMCLRVPVFENYYLCLGYIVMYISLYMFGMWEGTLVGVLGTILYCVLISGFRGMPGWVVGNIIIGIVLGFWLNRVKRVTTTQYQILVDLLTILVIVFSTATGILVVKSLAEVMLYREPFLIRIGNNIHAFIADVVVLVLSIPLCRIIEPKLRKVLGV